MLSLLGLYKIRNIFNNIEDDLVLSDIVEAPTCFKIGDVPPGGCLLYYLYVSLKFQLMKFQTSDAYSCSRQA